MHIPALAVFFLSGAAALLYQVVWQRMLVIFSGADVYSSTIIVAAFMAGLGIGHLSGGQLADRFSRRANVLMFAAAELAIAVFSVFSRGLYYDLLYQRLGPAGLAPAVMAAILFVSLLWPTFFMGMSLPLLARAFTESIERAASTVGALYGVNTLGAAVGALVATWWILPRFGLEGSLRIGVMLNLTCAAAVLPFVVRFTASRTAEVTTTSVASTSVAPRVSPANPPTSVAQGVSPTNPPTSVAEGFSPAGKLTFSTWAAIYGLSGLLALSLEIAWFRLLGVMVKSTAFTFGTLLTVYLAGLGAGSLAGSAYVWRIRRPAVTFLALQTAVGLSAALLVAMFIGLSDDVRWFREYFGGYEPLNVRESVGWLRALLAGDLGSARLPWQFVVLYFALPAVLIVPPTFLMGFSFPVLQRVVQTDLARLGRRVGLLLVANIAGSVLGTVLTGWVSLDVLGTAGTLKVLAGLSVCFVLFGVALQGVVPLFQAREYEKGGRPLLKTAGAIIVMLLGVWAMPDAATLWARLHGAGIDRIIYGEDASGLSVLRIEPGARQARATVFVNGVGQSVMPYGDVHTALGMLPAFLHPDPRQVAIIGLGSGDTVYGVAGRPQIETITSIEIIRPQLDTLKRLSRRYPYGGLLGLLSDPRIEYISGDGRIFLMHSARTFDIIEADALRPSSAYSGNLYSDAYFTLVRDRLQARGLAATWAPTVRVHNAFVRVFPYVVSVPGILIGSNEPIDLDRNAIAARLAERRVRDHYERAGIDAGQLLFLYLAEPAHYGPDFDRTALTDLNTDLFPKDEYDLTAPR